MFRKIPAEWKEYRSRNIIAILGLLLGLPAIIVFAILFKVYLPNSSEYSLIILTIIWAVLWIISIFRISRWPCPKCGVSWLSSQAVKINSKRCCANCGLCLYESP